MLYTPEQLYDWAMEEGFGEKMLLCKDYNRHGFTSTPVDGILVFNEEKGSYDYSIGLGDGTKIDVPFPQAKEMPEDVISYLMDHPEQLLAEVLTKDEESVITFAMGENDDVRLMNLNKNIMIDMLTLLNINTKGKFKVLMEEASLLKAANEERALVKSSMEEIISLREEINK